MKLSDLDAVISLASRYQAVAQEYVCFRGGPMVTISTAFKGAKPELHISDDDEIEKRLRGAILAFLSDQLDSILNELRGLGVGVDSPDPRAESE